MRSKAAPRTKPPEARRDELMNAAQRLFLRHGIDATTIEQITDGAGVAKGTFYLYFSSKEEIRAALGERFARQLLAGIAAAIADRAPDDWPGKLAAWSRAGIAGYLDAIRLHDVLFYGARAPTREGLTDNIVIDHLAGLLRDGVAAGAWPVAEPRFTALFLFSGLHGIVDDAHVQGRRIDRSLLTRRLEQLCFRAVGLHRERSGPRLRAGDRGAGVS
jgi:AcrR family transcriptional regulator